MDFYVLGKIDVGPYHTWFLPMEPDHRGDAPRCPECGTYLGPFAWLPPYRVKIEAYRSKLGDLADGFGSGGSLLVSERFRHAWEERKLKGIEKFTPLERVQVRPARLGKPSPVYYHIAPQRFGARIDFARSHFKCGGTLCDTCLSMRNFRSVKGFTLEDGTWTGEDIFRPWGYNTVVVTDRVRQMAEDYDLKNVELTPIEEYVFPPEQEPRVREPPRRII